MDNRDFQGTMDDNRLNELCSKWITCPRCRGDGTVDVVKSLEELVDGTCPTCDGDGFIWEE